MKLGVGDSSDGVANVLPLIREPLARFQGYEYRPWKEIFRDFRGLPRTEEAEFFVDRIERLGAKRVIDFGVGSGSDLDQVLACLSKRNLQTLEVSGIDIDEHLLEEAAARFRRGNRAVSLHRADWLNLAAASPSIDRTFDFGLLTGNSLTHISAGERVATLRKLSRLLKGLSQLLRPGGHLFIDTRNFDYIRTLMCRDPLDRMEEFKFSTSVYYHGVKEGRYAFPAYVSDTLVVFHYYDVATRIWSANDFFPLYQEDMTSLLSEEFNIEETLHDFSRAAPDRSLFCQYLVRVKPQ